MPKGEQKERGEKSTRAATIARRKHQSTRIVKEAGFNAKNFRIYQDIERRKERKDI